MNALAHHGYAIVATDIELSIYNGGLELVSLRQLPNTVTVDKVPT